MKDNVMDLYDQMTAAGSIMDSHYSDLYVPVNDITRAIVRDYKYKKNVTTFKCQIDGKVWYDIPFAYKPYWEGKFH